MPESSPIPYGRQWLDDDDVEAVTAVLRSDWLTTGPLVAQFETALAQRCAASHAVAVNSGSAALHAAYAGAGLSAKDSIVTSPLTFAATATAALHLGATVRFADVDNRTGNIDPDAVREIAADDTKLIVPVDYAGLPADYDALAALAEKLEAAIVADAAHSLGASYRGRPVGSLANATAVSFHPVKAVTTAEGGAIVTDDEDIARAAGLFRNHGIVRDEDASSQRRESWYYEIRSLGLNYRLPDLLCALGISQLSKLDRFLARRRAIAARYSRELASVDELILPPEPDHAEPAWHLYVIRVRDTDRRDALFAELRSRGLGVQVHYIPVYLHPLFRDMGYAAGLCPIAERFAASAVSIPLYPRMTDDDVDRVIEIVTQSAEQFL